jgi:hypothetical protein
MTPEERRSLDQRWQETGYPELGISFDSGHSVNDDTRSPNEYRGHLTLSTPQPGTPRGRKPQSDAPFHICYMVLFMAAILVLWAVAMVWDYFAR